MTLQRAAGAVPAPRVVLSRAAEERAEPDVIARALRSPGTRILRLREGKADVGLPLAQPEDPRSGRAQGSRDHVRLGAFLGRP